jgi:dTDP-4-dehydrorhamnose 3,5-epimerase
VQVRPLTISGALEVTPRIHADERGVFLEWYRFDLLSEHLGHAFDLRQANISSSARGVLRGIHYADVPPGQAKYVTAVHGSVVDYIVDLRVGSPTFGLWDSVELDDRDRRAVYIPEGLGHAFVATSEAAVVSYLVSDVYRPGAEHGVNPLDPAVGLDLPFARDKLVLSAKDAQAPSLAEAEAAGALPKWNEVSAYTASLGGRIG